MPRPPHRRFSPFRSYLVQVPVGLRLNFSMWQCEAISSIGARAHRDDLRLKPQLASQPF
ncbi:hypothetical protein GGI35DRAFT_437328, partial [Trichoderma velutinum]